MAEPDAFDPTHALDGWRPPAPAPLDLDGLLRTGGRAASPLLLKVEQDAFDPTHLLDGWHPPVPAPLDLEIRSLLRAGSGPDEAKLARLKARGYEMLDVEDIELPDAPAPRVVLEAWVDEVPAAPPLAEAELTPPGPPAEAAFEAPLPEASWPLFTAEAQVLDAGALPPIEPEAVEPLDMPPLIDAAAPAPEAGGKLEMPVVEDVELPEASPVAVIAEGADAPPAGVEAASAPPEPEPAQSMDNLPVDVEEPKFERAGPAVEDAEPPALSCAAAEVASAPVEPEPEVQFESTPAVDGIALPDPQPEAAVEAAAQEPEAVLPDLETASAPSELEPAALTEDVAFADEPFSPADAEPMLEPVTAPPVETIEPEPAPLEGSFPAAIEPPVVDFRASPPPVADPGPLLDDIQLPQVPPQPAVFETPVLDFRVAPPPPGPDPQQLIDDIVLPQITPPPDVAEAPELDIHAFAPQAEPDPRLVAQWQPQAWTVLARRVAGASTEVRQATDGLHVENHATQWLCALWPPLAAEPSLLERWPEMAALVGAEEREDALQTLLKELPAEAPLWAAALEADWGLVAELVLHQDDGLRPTQVRALRELAEAERNASLARLNAGYQPQGRVARRRA